MRFVRGHGVDVVLVVLAIVVQRVTIAPGWIEDGYANGIYAGLARTLVPLANAVPFALGDVLLVAIVAGMIAWYVRALRAARGARLRTIASLAVRTAGVLALILLWADGAWMLNYRRVPVSGRVAYDPARVTAANVSAFSREIVAGLNREAPRAHAQAEPPATMRAHLATAFAPVVARLGDRWDVIVTRPKATLLQPYFASAGIGGQFDPFAFETIVNTDFLPFELPFALAHEWGHVAGFGDESDANLIAALTCLRSADPLVRYSGYFWAYGYLPESDRRRLAVTRRVADDLAAARARFLAHYRPTLSNIQWFTYDKYLRANRVGAGVVSYSLFIQVLVGAPRDAAGLPRRRS